MKVCSKIISFVLMLSIVLSMLLFTPFSAFAESINPESTIQLEATCNYDDAFEVLDKINELRREKGLANMTMDPQMMEDAMQRAAELMVFYAHARPDGSSYCTINENVYAENIATGYSSPAAAMNGWVNSEFHYANMMSEDFNCIGIGAVVHNGVYCWVQLFGFEPYEDELKISDNVTKEFDIYLGNMEYDLSINISQSIFAGDSTPLQVIGQTKDNTCYYILSNDDFTFSSSDETVMKIEGEKAVAVDVGNATITAKSDYATITAQVEVVEFCAGVSRQCGDNVFWDYKDGTMTFSGTGEMYDYNTQDDENYNIIVDAPYTDAFKNVKKVVVNEGITKVGMRAFAFFGELETVELPSTLQEIGKQAFYECYRLKKVTMQEGIKEIPFGCFDTCFSLNDITLPDSVERIEGNAFLYCSGLYNLNTPKNLEYIAGGAFFECRNLREFTIPYAVEEIESGTFNHCRFLEKLVILNPDVKFGVPDMFSSIADTLTIYGYEDSTAERHCRINSIAFVSLGDAPVEKKLGDVNFDREISVLDATEIQRHLAQITPLSEDALSVADANSDGEVSVMDATHIQRFVAQIIPQL